MIARGATLVTGATGFAGSHLLDLLAGTGDLVGWHRPGGTPPPAVDGVRWQAVDMLDATSVRTAIESSAPARVYHCAGAANVGRAWNAATATLAVNVRGTHHLIESLRELAPKARLLIPSSGLVYAPSDRPLSENDPLRPTSPYGLSKLAQEMLGVNSTAPEICIARPFNHFGPRQDPGFVASSFARSIAMIEAGLSEPEMQVGNLTPLRDLTDVRDTVRAYQVIMEHAPAGRPYNVCTGRVVAVSALLDRMRACARVPIAVVTDPSRYRPNDLPIVQGDPTRIHDELHWAPTVPLEQTVDDLLEYWRAHIRST